MFLYLFLLGRKQIGLLADGGRLMTGHPSVVHNFLYLFLLGRKQLGLLADGSSLMSSHASICGAHVSLSVSFAWKKTDWFNC